MPATVGLVLGLRMLDLCPQLAVWLFPVSVGVFVCASAACLEWPVGLLSVCLCVCGVIGMSRGLIVRLFVCLRLVWERARGLSARQSRVRTAAGNEHVAHLRAAVSRLPAHFRRCLSASASQVSASPSFLLSVFCFFIPIISFRFFCFI